MPRKTNPENEVSLSPTSAAPARPRRARTTARVRPTPAAKSPAASHDSDALERSPQAGTVAVDEELSHEEIARVAYALWEDRGCQGGSPEEDWLRAEQQLRESALTPKVS